MAHWLHDTMVHWQAGEEFVTAATQRLAQDWSCFGAERWHAAMQEIDATVTLVDIFRTRVTFP